MCSFFEGFFCFLPQHRCVLEEIVNVEIKMFPGICLPSRLRAHLKPALKVTKERTLVPHWPPALLRTHPNVVLSVFVFFYCHATL